MNDFNLTICDLERGREYHAANCSVSGKYKLENNELLTMFLKDGWKKSCNSLFDIIAMRFKKIEEKKRYWQWVIFDITGEYGAIKPKQYMDDEGLSTRGMPILQGWSGLKKTKIESDYIEV